MKSRLLILSLLFLIVGLRFFSKSDGVQQEGSLTEESPKAKSGSEPNLTSLEDKESSETVDPSSLRIPTQQERVQAKGSEETPTDPPEVQGEVAADRRLKNIQKSITEFEEESFDEAYVDDETLLDSFKNGKGPDGQRWNNSEERADLEIPTQDWQDPDGAPGPDDLDDPDSPAAR